MSRRKTEQQPLLPMLFADAGGVYSTGKGLKQAQLPDYVRGHRARLKERFENGGPQAMPDYELLEMLLFQVVPRKNVKELASLLLKEFGSLNHVISASTSRLKTFDGVGPKVIQHLKLSEAICQRMLRSKLLARPVISSWDALIAYCHATMAYRDKEKFIVLYLDNKNILIRDEITAEGTVNHVAVYPREIAARALELAASAVILVHNHPSGDHTPSQADIDMTKAVEMALNALNITLHDHLVIGENGETSFRSEGYLDDVSDGVF